MRKTTERPEALEAGTVKKVGTNTKIIISEVQNLLDNELAYKEMISRKILMEMEKQVKEFLIS